MSSFLQLEFRFGLRHQPVIWLLVVVLVVMQLPIELARPTGDRSVRQARREMGAVTTLIYVQEPQLQGPIDLWQGEGWRIPATTLQHENLVTLAVTVLLLIVLGSLLEPRLGHFGCLLFVVLAATVSSLAEVLRGRTFTGMSGVVAAMFAFLAVRRRHDSALSHQFPEAFLQLGTVLLASAVMLDLTGFRLLPGAAVATGAVWGALSGLAFPGPNVDRGRLRQTAAIGFAAAHLLLVPAFALCMFPPWSGMYQWHLARQAAVVPERVAHYRAALQRDPSLEIVWKHLALIQAVEGQRFGSWTTALKGLNQNRSSEELTKLCRELWKGFHNLPDRLGALQLLQEEFGEETPQWQARLDLSWNFRVLGEHQADQGQLAAAWQSLLEGLLAHPQDQRSLDMLEKLWLQLPPEDRLAAVGQLAELFPDSIERLQIRLGMIQTGEEPLNIHRMAAADRELAEAQDGRFALDQQVILPPAPDETVGLEPHDLRAPAVDPDAPDSASAGTRL